MNKIITIVDIDGTLAIKIEQKLTAAIIVLAERLEKGNWNGAVEEIHNILT